MTQTEPETIVTLIHASLTAGEVQKTLLRSEPTEPLIVRVTLEDGRAVEAVAVSVERFFQPGRGWLTIARCEERPDEFIPLLAELGETP